MPMHFFLEIRECYKLFDINGKGSFGTREIAAVARSIGFEFEEADLKEMVAEVDQDGMKLSCIESHFLFS